MRRRRLFWQLFPSYLLVTLSALAVVSWFVARALERHLLDSSLAGLQARVLAVDNALGPTIDPAQIGPIAQLCRRLDDATDTRLTVILPSGEVLCDSRAGVPLEPHANRPEVQQALAEGAGSAVRFSTSVDQEMLYFAAAVRRNGETLGVVRAALPTGSIYRQWEIVRWNLVTGALVATLFAGLMSLLVSRRMSRPLEQMRAGAERFAAGDFSEKLAPPGSAELSALADTLNQMAAQLEDRIARLMRQSSEQQAVMASMVEGVLAVDSQQRVISLNRAAARLLTADQMPEPGQSLPEVIRNADLRRFVAQALGARAPIEGEIVMHGVTQRAMQAHGTALRDETGRPIGAVIVLNDVTGFRRLESIRRDFVANVSHELKTPITSIKGFVETLLDGALGNPEDSERFLRIIARQADRMHAIIDDLLSLATIEQSQEGDIELEAAPIRPILEEARANCQAPAGERRVEIHLECDEQLSARVNAPLLEQAVTNLLDNAIKYSQEGGTVRLGAERRSGDVAIFVEDHGCGIPAEHLPRIFERFYRVDKGRSRAQGGTGLGLSIVKHIVNAHHGRMNVESTPGEGSQFSIILTCSPAHVESPLPGATG